LKGLDPTRRKLIGDMEASIPSFVELLVNHRPLSLRGASLRQAVTDAPRQPNRLRAWFEATKLAPERLQRVSPSLSFALISQARADGKLSPEAESELVAKLLTHWAVYNSLDTSTQFAAETQARALALVT
jgi:hypothetical protein